MADPVAASLLEYRKQFPALEECVHFISHSLGCVPAQAKDDLCEFFDLWRTKSITARSAGALASSTGNVRTCHGRT